MLMRYCDGETKLWSVVRVPSVEDEDVRNLNRELEGLKKERTMHRNRIKRLLIQQGLRVNNPSHKKFLEQLETLRTWEGQQVPPVMKSRVIREYERLEMVEDQIKALEREKKEKGKNANTVSLRKVSQLGLLYGIGPVSS